MFTVVKCDESVVKSILKNEEQMSYFSNISLEPQILFKEKESLMKDVQHVNSIHCNVYSLRGLMKPRGVYNQLDIPLCSEFTDEIIEFRQHRSSTFSQSSNTKKWPAPISPIPPISYDLLKKNTIGYFNRHRQAYRALQQRRIKRNAITFAFNHRDRRERANYLYTRWNKKRLCKPRLNKASLLLLKAMKPCSVKLEKLSEEFIADSTIVSEIESCRLEYENGNISSHLHLHKEKSSLTLEMKSKHQEVNTKRCSGRNRPSFYRYRDTPVRGASKKSIVMSPVSYKVKEFVLIKPNNNNNNINNSTKRKQTRKKKRYIFSKPVKSLRKNTLLNNKTSKTNLPLSGPKSVRVIISPTCKARADIHLAKDVSSNICCHNTDDEDDDEDDCTIISHKFDNCSSINYSSEGHSTWLDVDSSFLTSSDESSNRTSCHQTESGRIISASLIAASSQSANNIRQIHKSLSICKSRNKNKPVADNSRLNINSNLNAQSRTLRYRYKLIRSASFHSPRAQSASPVSNSMKSTKKKLSPIERFPLNELKVLGRDSHSTPNHSSAGSFEALRHLDLPCSSLSDDSSRSLDQIDSLSDSTIETPRQSRRQRRLSDVLSP